MITIVTHNFPKEKTDSSGIFIKNLWDIIDEEYEVIGYEDFKSKSLPAYLLANWKKLRRRKNLIVAYWIFPAGILAYLSRRNYILNCVGLDIFMIRDSKLLKWMAKPILARAKELVFIGQHPKNVFERVYGDRYRHKSQLIHLPVDSGKFN
ncbi:MAG: hypothetical protein ACOYVF_07490 [Candidatus Zixiibacteriota bacterium]